MKWNRRFPVSFQSEFCSGPLLAGTEVSVPRAVEPSRTVPERALRAFRAFPCLVDAKSSSAEFLTVEGLNCACRSVVIHFDESEAFRTVRFPVDYEFDAADFPVLGKKIANFIFCCTVRQIAHI